MAIERGPLERDIRRRLVYEVKKRGGEIRKLAWVCRANAPDELVLLYGAHFVELKKPGGGPRAGQLREHKRMAEHGVRVWVIDTYDKIDEFIETIYAQALRSQRAAKANIQTPG